MPHPGYIKKTICEGVAYINLNTAADDIINSLSENDINKLKLHYKKEDFKTILVITLNIKLGFPYIQTSQDMIKKIVFLKLLK